MPRPLIIKIESSATNSNGTVPLPLRLRNKSESDAVMVHTNNVGLVRSLINRYEPSPNLTKAKSLQSLERREPVRRRSQVEAPKVGKDEEKFDFKSVRMKFETSVKRDRESNAVKTSTKAVGSGVQQKARQLLLDESYGIDDQLWKERVVELLKEICNGESSEEIVEKSSAVVLDEKREKVRDIASLYERQISTGTTVMKPKESFTKYFSNTEDRDGAGSSSESELSENSQGSQPNSGGVKITELRSYFEPANGECERVAGVNGERLLPPTKITVLEGDQVERSMERIDALIRDIEKQQRRIVDLSKEDYEQGSQINEELIQALIHLDEVPTFGDVSLQAKRKKAFLLVQTSIRQLIDNRRS